MGRLGQARTLGPGGDAIVLTLEKKLIESLMIGAACRYPKESRRRSGGMRKLRSIDGPAPIDGDRIAVLRDRIAAGLYRIDPRAIADKMIALDLQSSR